MICDNCGYEKNPDDALSCSLCGKVFRKEKIEDRDKEKFVKKSKEPESDDDFLDHDGPVDYRDIIHTFKKLRKRILHPIEVCTLSSFCIGLIHIVFFFLNKWGIIPTPISYSGKGIFFALSFIIPVITLSVFFMKKTTKNILMLSGFSILLLLLVMGSRMFDIIIGWRGVPQLVSPSILIIFLLVVLIGTIVYRFLRRKK